MHTERILDNIKSPDDIKNLPIDMLEQLAQEIRDELILTISHNGGHLAPNLGVVELTIALEQVFNLPKDQIVWDVGHQSYTHKILTGRLDKFSTIRTEGGISGFPKRCESIYDCFDTGHSSTSISAAFGLANANRLNGNNNHVVAVIGDGALTGGLAYEGLNNAGRYNKNFTVVLNDNKMSINRNVGAMARHLAVTRTKSGYNSFKFGVENTLRKIPIIGKPIKNFISKFKKILKSVIYRSTIFEEMGFKYIGPIDGHDLKKLIQAFTLAKNSDKPTFVHICTIKGKGYKYAEQNPKAFHGISGFDVETGEKTISGDSFSTIFGNELVRLAQSNKKICAITAAMKSGTGLTEFAKQFYDRFFDVGIAEGHAVTFAGGLAANGMLPVFAVYSSFLQRAYDQIIEDIAMQGHKVVIAIDRAGFVGDDGETHQGIFDIAMFNSIPNVTVYAPTYYDELKAYLYKCLYREEGVCAIRYPRGVEPTIRCEYYQQQQDFSIVSDRENRKYSKICIITYGTLFANALKAKQSLKDKNIECDIIKLNKIIPINEFAVSNAMQYSKIFFFEETLLTGGIGEKFLCLLNKISYKGECYITAIEDKYISQASVERQLELNNLSWEKMVDKIIERLK